MEIDDRDDDAEVCCVKVPLELVNALITGMRETLDAWYTENDVEPDLELTGGAIMVAADIIMTRIFGDDAQETVQ